MKVGLVLADTYPDKRIARFALERTLSEFSVHECLLLSDSCFLKGVRHVKIKPLRNLADYNGLILDRLREWAHCDSYLVVQWDGFALDGRQWRDEFFEYDYIGAPWLHMQNVVGQGGFSLRSRKLIDALHRIRRREDVRDRETAEDLQICFKYRDALQLSGIRIATADVAGKFSFERVDLAADAALFKPRTFGFHGVFNFPLVLTEGEILAQFDSILPRIENSPAIWYLFLWNAWHRRFQDLGAKAIAALAARDARVWAAVTQKCLRQGMPADWLRGV
jgi:hypothetical protein